MQLAGSFHRPFRFIQFLPLAGSLLLCSAHAASPPRTTTNFDGNWKFHQGASEGAEQVAADDSHWRSLDLPHDWSVEHDFSQDHASGTGFLPGGTGWYRKGFALPESASGQIITVEFDGVYRNSDVWINGTHLGHRPNGYIGFHYNLTPHLNFGIKENVIAVRVERENVADSRWYTGTGIFRHVRLIQTQPVHIAPNGVFLTTPRVARDSADINTLVEVINESQQPAPLRIVTEVRDASGKILSQSEDIGKVPPGISHSFSTWQKIRNPDLWSPDSPALYHLTTRVLSNGVLLDQTSTPFGIRKFHFDPAKGFFINGKNRRLKGVCLHHDGGVVGAAVPFEVLERRLRLIKEIGGNAIRCSHNPMAPELYSLCDKLGLLVMDEAFDEWETGKRKWVKGRNVGAAQRFGYAEAFEEWAERDLTAMVRQHRNHPSIIMWSIGNEIDYPTDPYVHPESRVASDFSGFSTRGKPSVTRLAVVAPKLIAAVKAQDPSRPVTMALANVPAANGTGLADMLDVAGYNYQEKNYDNDHRDFPNRVIFGSENGRRAESWAEVLKRDFISGLFLWAGFDFLGEAGKWPTHGSRAGLFDRCGFPKTSTLQYEALWKEEPVVRITSAPTGRGNDRRRARRRLANHWTWDTPPGTAMNILTFSNCDEVELTLNGRSLGRKAPDHLAAIHWQAAYEVGELIATGYNDGKKTTRETLRTASAPSQIIAHSDQSTMSPGSVAHIELAIADQNGLPLPHYESPVSIRITGGGKLMGLDNGIMDDPTPLRSSSRTPHHGRLLALVRAGKSNGTVTITATAKGLKPLELKIQVSSPIPR